MLYRTNENVSRRSPLPGFFHFYSVLFIQIKMNSLLVNILFAFISKCLCMQIKYEVRPNEFKTYNDNLAVSNHCEGSFPFEDIISLPNQSTNTRSHFGGGLPKVIIGALDEGYFEFFWHFLHGVSPSFRIESEYDEEARKTCFYISSLSVYNSLSFFAYVPLSVNNAVFNTDDNLYIGAYFDEERDNFIGGELIIYIAEEENVVLQGIYDFSTKFSHVKQLRVSGKTTVYCIFGESWAVFLDGLQGKVNLTIINVAEEYKSSLAALKARIQSDKTYAATSPIDLSLSPEAVSSAETPIVNISGSKSTAGLSVDPKQSTPSKHVFDIQVSFTPYPINYEGAASSLNIHTDWDSLCAPDNTDLEFKKDTLLDFYQRSADSNGNPEIKVALLFGTLATLYGKTQKYSDVSHIFKFVPLEDDVLIKIPSKKRCIEINGAEAVILSKYKNIITQRYTLDSFRLPQPYSSSSCDLDKQIVFYKFFTHEAYRYAVFFAGTSGRTVCTYIRFSISDTLQCYRTLKERFENRDSEEKVQPKIIGNSKVEKHENVPLQKVVKIPPGNASSSFPIDKEKKQRAEPHKKQSSIDSDQAKVDTEQRGKKTDSIQDKKPHVQSTGISDQAGERKESSGQTKQEEIEVQQKKKVNTNGQNTEAAKGNGVSVVAMAMGAIALAGICAMVFILMKKQKSSNHTKKPHAKSSSSRIKKLN